jgi:hypothetical protein
LLSRRGPTGALLQAVRCPMGRPVRREVRDPGSCVADCGVGVVIRLVTVRTPIRPSQSEFSAFVRRTEPRLLQALVATYGPVDGREAAVDALSWAAARSRSST